MLIGLDHLILAVAHPDESAVELQRELGVRAAAGGRHAEHGTFNRIVWLGDSYIELMGVFDPRLAAHSWWGAHIGGLLTSTPAALAGLVVASDDLDSDALRLQGQGSAISEAIDGRRLRTDGREVRWRVARLPASVPDIGLLFLIEHDTAAAEWTASEREARAAEVHPIGSAARLSRVVLPVADVRATTLAMLRDFGLQFRPSLAGGGARDASVGTQTLRVTAAAAGGAPEIGIRAGHRRVEAELFGCRWVVEPI